MSDNAPDFDPLNATSEESDDMLAGYRASVDRNAIKPALASVAFEHGWRMGRNDMAGVVDDDQRVLAKRKAAQARYRRFSA